MKILAWETTETAGTVAAASDSNVLLEKELNHSIRSAQSLAPGIKGLLEHLGWRPQDVELVAVTVGPGSFTGLRVGVATAKIFAYAMRAEILGLDTLQSIAMAAPDEIGELSVAMDAQRGDVVARSFRRGTDGWFHPSGPQRLVSADAWLAGLPSGSMVSGPVLKKLIGRLPPGVQALDPKCWDPRAGNVARLAAHLYAAGRRDDLWGLVPRYSRRSAAEEKWESRGKGKEV
jgi:tRNA threonylcarbamoyladenosine biosynthesis protein TsaB